MKRGKVANLIDWNSEDEYDEFVEQEIKRKQDIAALRSFKRYADSIISESRKVQNSKSYSKRI